MKNYFYILLLIIVSCSTIEDQPLKSELLLEGSWSELIYKDTTFIAHKVSELPTDDYGFTFKSDNVFLENKNSGWCGTPPIMYALYEGTWEMLDSVVNITVPYWGGTAKLSWKILTINENSFEAYILKQDYEMNEEF